MLRRIFYYSQAIQPLIPNWKYLVNIFSDIQMACKGGETWWDLQKRDFTFSQIMNDGNTNFLVWTVMTGLEAS